MSRLAPRYALVLALPLAAAGAIAAVAQTAAEPEQSQAAPAAPADAPEATQRPFGDHGGHEGHGGHRMAHGRGAFGPGRMGPPAGGLMQLFDEADADGDGALTQEELDGFRGEVVSGADQGGDGAIDLDEFEAIYLRFTRERMVDLFQELDADGDGTISSGEMDDRFGGVVERLDRNDDGKLSTEDRGRR